MFVRILVELGEFPRITFETRSRIDHVHDRQSANDCQDGRREVVEDGNQAGASQFSHIAHSQDAAHHTGHHQWHDHHRQGAQEDLPTNSDCLEQCYGGLFGRLVFPQISNLFLVFLDRRIEFINLRTHLISIIPGCLFVILQGALQILDL